MTLTARQAEILAIYTRGAEIAEVAAQAEASRAEVLALVQRVGYDRSRAAALVDEYDRSPQPEPEPERPVPAGPVPGTVLDSYLAELCLECGSRYRNPDHDHPCGPLTPVTVTITTRPAG